MSKVIEELIEQFDKKIQENKSNQSDVSFEMYKKAYEEVIQGVNKV